MAKQRAVTCEFTVEKRDRHATLCGLLYCFASFVFGVQVNLVGPAASILAEQINGTEADLAPVVGIIGIMCMVGGMPSGAIVDAFPGHAVLVWSLVIQGICLLSIQHCTSVTMLTLVYAVVALMFNNINTGVNSLTPWVFHFNSQQSAFWLNMVSAVYGIGGLVAPLLVSLCVEVLMVGKMVFSLVALACFLLACVFLWVPSPRNPAAVPVLPLGVTDGLDAPLLAKAPATFSRHEHDKHAASQQSGLRERHPDDLGPLTGPDKWKHAVGLLVPVTGFVFVNMSIQLTMGAWIFTYAIREAKMETEPAELLTSLFWFAFTSARVLAATMASFLKPTTILLISTPWAMLGCALPLVPAVQGPWCIYACVCLVAIGASAVYANTLSLMAQYLALDGFLNGYIGTVAGVGGTVFPSLVPVLVKHQVLGVEWQWLMYIMFVMAVLQFVHIFWILEAGRRVRRHQVARMSVFARAAAWRGMMGFGEGSAHGALAQPARPESEEL